MPTISQFSGSLFAYTTGTTLRLTSTPYIRNTKLDIEKLDIISGHLPRRALGLVLDWAELHQQELRENWVRAEKRRMLNAIKPLE